MSPATREPVSTFRLQIRRSFDLHAAAAVVDYVHALGADWLYLSPLLKAEPGSDHGYDVIDHSEVDPERGGSEGLLALATAAHDAGLGVLVDVVPNHVGIATATDSVWWRDLLVHGRGSRYAEAFDIDWDFGDGKIRIPVLGDEEHSELRVEGGELRYHDHRFPIAPATAGEGENADDVHRRQHYELVSWRRADGDLNYRRFFAVNTLAAVRVEVPWVFAESHREILRWVSERLVDGLRVDHPDGLFDPGAYFDELAAASGDVYVVAEKILEGEEHLPPSWRVAGTTGYDALGDIDRVLVDPAGQAVLDALDMRLRDSAEPVSWTDMIHGTKRSIADGILHSEVLRIDRQLAHVLARPGGAHVEESPVADAVAELLAWFPVYRSYLPLGREHLQAAADAARASRPELVETIDAVVAVLADPEEPAARRFQQTSGMVMAKGVEDTAFYRYNRLGSLTEVGGDPSEFSISVEEFHRRQQVRQASYPRTMTALSTHDTKRGEDVRARLDVLAEVAGEWETALARLRALVPLSDGPLEQLLWQAIVGAWPASRDRLHAYAEKAAREAGNSTAWNAPNDEFEQSMHRLVDSAFDDSRVVDVLADLLDLITAPGWSNAVAAKLIQLTAPGVPDIYQGSELWEQSLVDPDNRRPVDFEVRRALLDKLDGGWLPPVDESGAAKLLVTSRALRLRRDRPDLFTRYVPLEAYGAAEDHVIGFDRGGAVTVATRLPVGLSRVGGWGDTSIVLSRRSWRDVITGTSTGGGSVAMGELLATYPVALLVPDSEAS